MARITKEYDARYTEFLDVAQTLFFSKGYEQTSVQEMIDTVGVAKGTFYHYFRSKIEILEALIERMSGEVALVLEAMVADTSLSAVQKMERFFARSITWKAARKQEMLAAARVLLQDENALLREKVRRESARRFAPLAAQIICQGVEEGAFVVAHPAQTAELLLAMPQPLQDTMAALLFADALPAQERAHVESQLEALNLALARVLGMPDSSYRLIDMDLAVWLPAASSSSG